MITCRGPEILREKARAGGLGLSHWQWEALHGLGIRSDVYLEYEDGAYAILFINGRVARIECRFPDQEPDLASARGLARQLRPPDSRLLLSYSPAGSLGLIIDLCVSPALARQFAAGSFPGGQPGSFVTVYVTCDEAVSAVTLALGNNNP